jgi:hypothetical protein
MRRDLETSSNILAKRRLISFVAAWIIAMVSVFVPDLTWVQIPSVVNFTLFVGAGVSVILSFTLLARNREFSMAQPLALMASLLTAMAAMVTFESVPAVSVQRVTLLSLCMAWQLFATFTELKLIVERGNSEVVTKLSK